MQFQNVGFFKSLALCKFMNMVISLGMADSFINITKGLSVDREAIFNNDLCFGFGKAIAFKCVTCICKPNTIKLPQGFYTANHNKFTPPLKEIERHSFKLTSSKKTL